MGEAIVIYALCVVLFALIFDVYGKKDRSLLSWCVRTLMVLLWPLLIILIVVDRIEGPRNKI